MIALGFRVVYASAQLWLRGGGVLLRVEWEQLCAESAAPLCGSSACAGRSRAPAVSAGWACQLSARGGVKVGWLGEMFWVSIAGQYTVAPVGPVCAAVGLVVWCSRPGLC